MPRTLIDGRGNLNLHAEHEVKCKTCNSTVGYYLYEVNYIDASQSEDVWIVCTVCDAVIDLKLDISEMRHVRANSAVLGSLAARVSRALRGGR